MAPIFRIGRGPRTYWIYGVLMVLLTLAGFGNLYTHQFWDGWDDQSMLMDTAAIAKDISFLFSPDRLLPIRPSKDLIFLMGYLLWGENLAAFHVLQVGLHLFASLLLAYTLFKLGLDLELSLLAALIFLLNTAHFRAVHWLVCISYISALILGLSVLLCYWRFFYLQKPRWRGATLLALVAAIYAHPSAVSVVFFCTYLTWRKTGSVKQAIGLTWPLLSTAILFGALAYHISSEMSQSRGALASFSVLRPFQNLLWYLGRLMTSAHWIFRETSQNVPRLWEMGVGGLTGLVIYMLYRKRVFPAADWTVWAILTILPFLNNPPARLAFGPSRQLYFASVGSSVVLVKDRPNGATDDRFNGPTSKGHFGVSDKGYF